MAELTALAGSLERLRLSERYSDLTVECKGKTFKVHRAIVCAQSTVFAAMINSNWLEAATCKINLEDDDPDIVAKMIDFLYKAQYDVGCGVGGGSTERSEYEGDDPQNAQEAGAPLIVHAKLYILGDKYDIPSLKELASRNYGEIVATQWNTKAFPESAEMIYNNIAVEGDLLKDVIYENARNNILTLINVPGFEGLLRRTNDFAADILISLIQNEKQKVGNTMTCRTCGSPQISGLYSPRGYGCSPPPQDYDDDYGPDFGPPPWDYGPPPRDYGPPPRGYGYRPARSSQGLGIPTIRR